MINSLSSNYHPVSNLSLVCKIIDRVVKSRLIDHLTSNKLLNPHQSAYCKHHSTETALSYIRDHLINAIGSHKVSCLCPLLNCQFSRAFDTVNYIRWRQWWQRRWQLIDWHLLVSRGVARISVWRGINFRDLGGGYKSLYSPPPVSTPLL